VLHGGIADVELVDECLERALAVDMWSNDQSDDKRRPIPAAGVCPAGLRSVDSPPWSTL
jgi:hypothetical protein